MESFVVLGALALLFALLHLGPLSERQVTSIANKWRQQELGMYFGFRHGALDVDLEFKRRMDSDGRIYASDEHLAYFPSIAASLLKYKKHEWIIIGFERAQSVVMMWMNKGSDNETAEFFVSIEEIARIAQANDCTSVLILHNHPNPDPAKYTASQPSQVDLAGAWERSRYLFGVGLNLFEYVCERGLPYEYHRCIADAFRPAGSYIPSVDSVNGVTRLMNLRLHIARLLGTGSYRRVVSKLQARAGGRRTRQLMPELPPAGWYADPQAIHEHRYWDGVRWSDFVANSGVVETRALADQSRSA